MPACCVCYTTDPTYLFPSFVSAMQARRHAAIDKADVAIFSFDADVATAAAFAQACAAEGIRYIPCDRSAIDGAPVMLARLFLTRIAPSQYAQFLYVDGDTQIAGALDPLIDAVVPPGQFLAANDPMTFAIMDADSHSRFLAQHLAATGFSQQAALNYFNTGVLRIARDGWERIGLQAWELFRRQPAASLFPDQDVLNLVGGPHCIPMSLAWNFPIFMLNARVAETIRPRIYHYMSQPKPWHGAFPPWDRHARTPYLEAIRRHPGLARYLAAMPLPMQLRYHLQQRYKQLTETFSWGRSAKRGRILDYERGLANAPAFNPARGAVDGRS